MLERIGFRYADHVDPFDGGPHFEADVKDVTLVRRFRTAKLGAEDNQLEAEDALVACERANGKNRFRAVRTQARFDNQVVYLPARAKEALGAKAGEKVSVIPFE
jgi:arginine N-succinyltransferase